MASQRQAAANRENGLKGGVKTEEGKAVSRLNARKHGIFASALTPEDAEELHGIEDRLVASIRPAGVVEEMLVEKLALTYLRMQRCARAEAEFHHLTWAEPIKALQPYNWQALQDERRRGGRGVVFDSNVFGRMVKLIDLYDARLTNQFLKLTREIERQQSLRAGQGGPASPQEEAEESNTGAAEEKARPADLGPVRSAAPDDGGTVGQDLSAVAMAEAECPTCERTAAAPAPASPEPPPASMDEQSQDAVGVRDAAQTVI
jgi:hypothetical protein